MPARKTPQKKPQGKSSTQITNVAKEIVDATTPDEIDLVKENPTYIVDVLLNKLPGALLKAAKGEGDSKSTRPLSKPQKPSVSTTARNAKQKKTQRELVLLLRDSNRYGLDDLHKLWQDFVDPIVDWVSETRRKNQQELASELVRKATAKGKLQEFAKAVMPQPSSGQTNSQKQGTKRKR